MALGAVSPRATASAATASAATAGEAATAAARAAAGRGERLAEAGAEVGDPERGRPAAEVARGADPIDRARVVQLLGHVQLGVLEHALRDPERDAIHEVSLPELERRGRRVLETGEVLEVAAERGPPLRLELRVLGTAAPEPAGGHRHEQEACVYERADVQRGDHDVVPARHHGAPAVVRDEEQDRADEGEADDPEDERQPAVGVPAPLLDRRSDVLLELREALRVRRPVVLELLAELGEPLGRAVENA